MNVRRLIAVGLFVWLSACAADQGNQLAIDELFQAARLAMWRGEFDAARKLTDEGIARAGKQSNAETSWRFRLLLCEVVLSQLDLTRAAACLSEEPPSDARLRDLHAQHAYLRAKALIAHGTLNEALSLLEAAQSMTLAGDDVWLDAEILGGQIRLRLGRWDDAETRLNAVVRRAEDRGDQHRRALALNNLGMGRLIRGRYDEAVFYFERVLSVAQLEEMAVYGSALNNAGICYARLGQFDLAINAQHKAVTIQERRGPSRLLVESLGSLGNTYLLSGDPRKALPFVRRAMDTAGAAKLTGEAALWAGNLATAHAELGEFAEAEQLNDQAARLAAANPSVKPVYFTLTAAHIARGQGNAKRAAELYEQALSRSDGTPAVIWLAHAGLARVAMSTHQPDRAARHFEAALTTIETTRSSLLRTEFRLSFLTQLIEFYQLYVDALVSEGRVDRALEIAESSRGRVLAEKHGIQTTEKTKADTLRSLSQRSGAVLLSYWLAPRRSSLWIVDAAGIRHVSLPPAKEIDDLVRRHQSTIHNALANPLAQTDSAGDQLYRLLVEPASSHLKPGAQVVIVPDGALHRLNFETLPVTGSTRHYWIEDVEVQIAPSLSMLSAQRPAASTRPSLLLIGDAPAREPEFPALRYASAEIANVAKHFSAESVSTHQKDRAVPDAYRNAPLDRFSVIHFTAHAVANTESPLDSAIMLSGPRDAFKLYARDVADRPLNADLVTVSACRSAGERTYSGEGLVGFSWAFLRAGAQRVIAGLWDVDDRSTADLMDRVYAAIARGVPPPRALREAKLAALRSGGTFAKPYYWAPFEVFTVVLEAKPSKSGTRSTSARLRVPEAPTHRPQAF